MAARVSGGSAWHLLQAYLTAIVAVGVMLGVSFLLPGLLQRDSTLMLLLVAVMFSGWCGSIGPGLLATLLGAVAAFFLFKTQAGLEQGVGIFFLAGGAISLTVGSLQRARDQAKAAGQRANAEAAAARRSTERLEVLTGIVRNQALFTLDSGGRINSWNRGAEELCGYSEVEAPGRNVACLYMPQEVAWRKPERDLERAAVEGRFEEKGWRRRQDGSRFWASVAIAALRDDRGQAVGFAVALQDLSRSHHAEEQLRESHEQLRQLNAKLQAVREYERSRIAQEIHDQLGQSLTGLKLELAWLRSRLDAGQTALIEKADGMLRLADATIGDMRRITTSLRPGVLDTLGLAAAIEWQCREFQSRTGIECFCDAEPAEAELDRDRSTTLFRILQESLTNVARHAAATQARIILTEEDGTLVMAITDNGRGIREEEKYGLKSLGLLGMRERVYRLGGEMSIEGKPKEGTTVTIRVPMAGMKSVEQ